MKHSKVAADPLKCSILSYQNVMVMKNNMIKVPLQTYVRKGMIFRAFYILLTHFELIADIDQRFSVFSRHLKKNTAMTLVELAEQLKRSIINPPPQMLLLDEVYDFKSWLEPVMCNISQFSFYHHFR